MCNIHNRLHLVVISVFETKRVDHGDSQCIDQVKGETLDTFYAKISKSKDTNRSYVK